MNDLPRLREGDAVALMRSQRMFGRLHFDPGAMAVGAVMHHGFQIERVRRKIIEPRAEPAEKRADLHAVIEVLPVKFEILLFVAHPNAPIERFFVVADGDMNHGAHEIVAPFDNAEVIREQAIGVVLVFGGPLERRVRTDRWEIIVL